MSRTTVASGARAADGRAVLIQVAALESGLGPVHVATRDGVLCALGFDDYWPREQAHLIRRFGLVQFEAGACADTLAALTRYFDGDIHALAGIPTDPGGTPFQARVWKALCEIPAGQTRSYRDLAASIGEPAAVRAVGTANGRNPIPLVIPCHRVIGADGRLVGYGGGLHRKDWLLRHEGARLF